MAGGASSATLEDNRSRELKYNDKDNKIQTTDAQGARFLYNYDQYGKLVSVIDMITSVTMLQREYDSKERLIKETDANGTVKELTYDCIDRITSVSHTQADGRIISANQIEYNEAYNSFDEMYMKLTVRGGDIFDQRETYYLFDYNNRQVEKTIVGEEQNHTLRYLYDYAGNNTVAIDPAGNETKLEYDCFGNPVRVIKPDGTEETSEYNFMGKQISATNGEYETVYTNYDSLGRKTKQEVPYTANDKYNAFKTYYDSRNNVVKEIDAKGNKKEYGYNERGFLTSASLYNDAVNGIVTNYDYDGEGRITKLSYGGIENADERKTFINTLDHLGRVTVRTDNLGYKQYYEYDNNGNVIKYTNRNGISTSYQYDGLNRKVQENNDKEGQTEYGYNDFNQLTYMCNGTQKTEYKYNKAGNLSKIIKDWTIESFEYDIRDNVTKRTTSDKDIDDIELGYEYNKLGQLTSVATPIETEKLYYDKAGRINYKENTQTGINKSYTYYPQGTVRNIMTRRDDNLVYSEYYEYDANGNKTYSDENGSVNEYSYDGMGRLKTVVENDTKQTEYEFDDYNNIKKEYELVGSEINTRSFYYDANNRLILSENKYTIEQYEYDNEGNMIQKKEGMGSNISTSYYQYDAYNRLNGFISDNTTAEYKYNLEGLRESKTVNDVKTRFVYNDANIVGEYTNGEYYKYYRGSELIGYENDRNQNYYFRQNSHGDVTALLDYAGNVIEDYTYNAYGKEQQISINPQGDKTILYQWQKETDTTHNPFRYCGEYTDLSSGLIYLRNRYYDSSVGRFISEDPIRAGENWYVYCLNNPVNRIDPTGLDSWVFYDDNQAAGQKGFTFESEAKVYEKTLSERHGTEVHLVPVDSVVEFSDAWRDQLGFDADGNAVTINEVIVIAHGGAVGDVGNGVGFMGFTDGDGKSTYLYAKDTSALRAGQDGAVGGLERKTIGALTFSVCNSANPDIYNLTYSFMRGQNITNSIIGWDGGTVFDHKGDKTLKAGGPKSYQGTFDRYNTTGRMRIGERPFVNNGLMGGGWKEKSIFD